MRIGLAWRDGARHPPCSLRGILARARTFLLVGQAPPLHLLSDDARDRLPARRQPEPYIDVTRMKGGRKPAALICPRNAKALIRVLRHTTTQKQTQSPHCIS